MGLFSPNLKENEFCWSKGLCQFLNIPVIYDGAKNYKQLTTHSWVNRRTDGQTDRQTTGILWDPLWGRCPQNQIWKSTTLFETEKYS